MQAAYVPQLLGNPFVCGGACGVCRPKQPQPCGPWRQPNLIALSSHTNRRCCIACRQEAPWPLKLSACLSAAWTLTMSMCALQAGRTLAREPLRTALSLGPQPGDGRWSLLPEAPTLGRGSLRKASFEQPPERPKAGSMFRIHSSSDSEGKQAMEAGQAGQGGGLSGSLLHHTIADSMPDLPKMGPRARPAVKVSMHDTLHSSSGSTVVLSRQQQAEAKHLSRQKTQNLKGSLLQRGSPSKTGG